MIYIVSYMYRHLGAILRRVNTTKFGFVSLCVFVKFYCSGPSLRTLLPPPHTPELDL